MNPTDECLIESKMDGHDVSIGKHWNQAIERYFWCVDTDKSSNEEALDLSRIESWNYAQREESKSGILLDHIVYSDRWEDGSWG